MIVPSAEAVWVGPGACYNKAGYWHVANPRVVYRLHGQVRSFGIASLISWRGVWYVVHFGGITRPAVGMVDAPASGPATPARRAAAELPAQTAGRTCAAISSRCSRSSRSST